MRNALPTRLLLAAGAAVLVSACTYVDRTPAAPQQPATLVVPQASPTVVMPSAPPPTVTVRPSY